MSALGLGKISTPSLSLRAVTPADRDHLFRVYASSREEELAIVPFSPQEKNAFLKMQFAARERQYAERFSTRDHVVVELGGTPIGYFWVHRGDDEVRILDVALLPEHRNVGLGTKLISSLIEEAGERRVPLRLHVLANSPARRLWERLGFKATAETTVYVPMELVP